jgi:hypothetical protein
MPLKWLAEKVGKVPITNRIVFEDKKTPSHKTQQERACILKKYRNCSIIPSRNAYHPPSQIKKWRIILWQKSAA